MGDSKIKNVVRLAYRKNFVSETEKINGERRPKNPERRGSLNARKRPQASEDSIVPASPRAPL
jgi:hypothetical protein